MPLQDPVGAAMDNGEDVSSRAGGASIVGREGETLLGFKGDSEFRSFLQSNLTDGEGISKVLSAHGCTAGVGRRRRPAGAARSRLFDRSATLCPTRIFARFRRPARQSSDFGLQRTF